MAHTNPFNFPPFIFFFFLGFTHFKDILFDSDLFHFQCSEDLHIDFGRIEKCRTGKIGNELEHKVHEFFFYQKDFKNSFI